MLGMKTYSKAYIEACRAHIAADVRAFRKAGAKGLETTYFNNLVVKLQYMFEHRLSGAEGKDGNPLNEVRVLCSPLILNGGTVQAGKLPSWPNSAVSGLTLPKERSVLGLQDGDPVKVTEDDFARLVKAFFQEIEARYP